MSEQGTSEKAEAWRTIIRLREQIQAGVNVDRNRQTLAALEAMLDDEAPDTDPEPPPYAPVQKPGDPGCGHGEPGKLCHDCGWGT